MIIRRNHKAIAKIISNVCLIGRTPQGGEQDRTDVVCSRIARELASYFARDNAIFNRDKFLKACTPQLRHRSDFHYVPMFHIS